MTDLRSVVDSVALVATAGSLAHDVVCVTKHATTPDLGEQQR